MQGYWIKKSAATKHLVSIIIFLWKFPNFLLFKFSAEKNNNMQMTVFQLLMEKYSFQKTSLKLRKLISENQIYRQYHTTVVEKIGQTYVSRFLNTCVCWKLYKLKQYKGISQAVTHKTAVIVFYCSAYYFLIRNVNTYR